MTRTAVSAIRLRHPDWPGLLCGPEVIRVTFEDGSWLEGAPDCGDAAFAEALGSLTVIDAEH